MASSFWKQFWKVPEALIRDVVGGRTRTKIISDRGWAVKARVYEYSYCRQAIGSHGTRRWRSEQRREAMTQTTRMRASQVTPRVETRVVVHKEFSHRRIDVTFIVCWKLMHLYISIIRKTCLLLYSLNSTIVYCICYMSWIIMISSNGFIAEYFRSVLNVSF